MTLPRLRVDRQWSRDAYAVSLVPGYRKGEKEAKPLRELFVMNGKDIHGKKISHRARRTILRVLRWLDRLGEPDLSTAGCDIRKATLSRLRDDGTTNHAYGRTSCCD